MVSWDCLPCGLCSGSWSAPRPDFCGSVAGPCLGHKGLTLTPHSQGSSHWIEVHLRTGVSCPWALSAEGGESVSVPRELVGATPWRGGDPQCEGPVTCWVWRSRHSDSLGDPHSDALLGGGTRALFTLCPPSLGPGTLWHVGAHRQLVAGMGCCERLWVCHLWSDTSPVQRPEGLQVVWLREM